MNLREGRWILAFGIVVHLFFLVSLKTQTLNPLFSEAEHAYGQAGDYFGIYQAGENLIHGLSIYDSEGYRDEAKRSVPYFYFYRYLPPTAYLFGLISLLLPPWSAYWNWVILNELLLLFMVLWILRLKAYRAVERRHHAALWLAFFPFYLEQWMGQFSFLMAVFLWIILRDGMPDRPETQPATTPAGRALRAWIASVVLKSFTALFGLSYLKRRAYRKVAIAAAAVLLLSAPYYLFRPEDLRQFLLLNFRPLPPGVHGGTLGASAFLRLLGWCLPQSVAHHLLDFRLFDVYVGNVPALATGLLILVASGWVVATRGRQVALNLQISLWTLTFFLLFKDVWEYHYVMLLPVVTALGLGERSKTVLFLGLLLALPTPYVLFQVDGSLPIAADLLHHASKAIPTICLFIWVYHRALRERGRTSLA